MDRRQFCRSAVAAGVTAAFLPGCGKETPVATQADTGIAAVSLDGEEIELSKAAIRELGAENGFDVDAIELDPAFWKGVSCEWNERIAPVTAVACPQSIKSARATLARDQLRTAFS